MKTRPMRPSSPREQKVREEIDAKVEAAVDEVLRRDWPAATAAREAGEYAQILRDVAQMSMLYKRELVADYLEVIAEENLKAATVRDVNLRVADQANDLREKIEMESIGLVAQALTQGAAAPAKTPKEPGPLQRGAAKAWSVVVKTASVCGALLFTFLAVAIAMFGDAAMGTWGVRIGAALFLLGVSTMLFVMAFFPGRLSGLNRRNTQSAIERKLRQDLEARYVQLRKER